MEFWDDVKCKEDLEIMPGVLDREKIWLLTTNTYLQHIEDMMDMGMNHYPDAVEEHLEDVMLDIFLCYSHVCEDSIILPHYIFPVQLSVHPGSGRPGPAGR